MFLNIFRIRYFINSVTTQRATELKSKDEKSFCSFPTHNN